MPRLLIVFDSDERGGAEEHVRVVAEGALAADWDVHVAFPRHPATDGLRRELTSSGIRTWPVVLGRIAPVSRRHAVQGLLADARATSAVLAAIAPDVGMLSLGSPDKSPGVMAGFARRRVPLVALVHLVRPGTSITTDRRRLYQLLTRLGQRWIGVSAATAAAAAEAYGISGSAVATVPNGVDFGQAPSDGERAASRQALVAELGLAPDDDIVLSVGRLSTQKAHEVVIAAAPAVLHARPTTRFVWAGEGDQRAVLQAAIVDARLPSGAVRLLGRRSDVPDLLRAADVLVLPSRFEGTPFAVLEALAAELPVVASDAAVAGPLAAGHGVVTFPVDDHDALAQRLLVTLRDPDTARARARVGRARALDPFSRERMITDLLSRLEEAASRTPARAVLGRAGPTPPT